MATAYGRIGRGYTLTRQADPGIALVITEALSDVRRGISAFAKLPSDAVGRGLTRLSEDLRSGRWEKLFGHLRKQDSLDLGYRLILAKPSF